MNHRTSFRIHWRLEGADRCGALDALKNIRTRILRTARHPIAHGYRITALLTKRWIALYEKADDFDAFNREAAQRFLLAAAKTTPWCTPLRTLRWIPPLPHCWSAVPDRSTVSVLPGVSHADRCIAMAKAHALDIRLSSAETFLTADDVQPCRFLFLVRTAQPRLRRRVQTEADAAAGRPDAALLSSWRIRTAACICETIPLYALDRQERYDHLTACLYAAAPLEQRKRFSVDDLHAVMKRLRARDGCPWDREQTHESLLSNLLEESYEFIEAAREDDPEHMCEELGDVLLQVMFHAVIAAQCGEFDLHDVTTAITGKLIERHPHVFGSVKADTASQVLDNWEQIKRKQRGIDTVADAMDNVSKGLSPAMRAAKVQHKAAKVGFDFPDVQAALEKVAEEYREVLRMP